MNANWIFGEEPQTYLAHTERPRFFCRIADADDRSARLSSHHYYLKGGYLLCDFDWIDYIPDAAKLRVLLGEAEQAWEYNQLLKREESVISAHATAA